MSFEIIRRKEGELSQKQEIRHNNVQISINDWGHLVIREFDKPRYKELCEYDREKCLIENNATKVCKTENYKCEHLKEKRVDDEHLIVFDKETTGKIISFIFSIRSTYEFKQLLKDIISKNGLPF